MGSREAQRRSGGGRPRRDSNTHLDAMRIVLGRVERWLCGSKPTATILSATEEAVGAVVRAPRWTDSQVEYLRDLLGEQAERGEPIASMMLDDLDSSMVWLGGQQADDDGHEESE